MVSTGRECPSKLHPKYVETTPLYDELNKKQQHALGKEKTGFRKGKNGRGT